MSSYPPPPPPYDTRAAQRAQKQAYRAQQQAYQLQQKMQRVAWKAQRRAMRRSSVVGPLLLLALGVYFLLVELHRVPAFYALEWFGRWWPVLLIGAGGVLLVEWLIDRDRPQAAGGPRTLGGGVVFLLVLLIVAGLASQAALRGLEWKQQQFGEGFGKLDEVLGNRSDAYEDLTAAVAPGGVLVIRSPHGDVTVDGTSTDGQVHVSVHKQAYSWNEADVQKKMRQLQPVLQQEGGLLTLSVDGVAGGQVELTVTVPPTCGVTVNADRGDVKVRSLQRPVTISANHGDVDLGDVTADVQATINDDDASVTLTDIKGGVSIQGHTGDVEITRVTGPVSLQGDFYGTTHLQNIAGAIHFDSSRTHFSAARLDDEFSVENDSLEAGSLLGPVVLKTSNKNITLNRVQGSVDVTDRDGEVNVTSVAPLGPITVSNEHGSVDVGVPPGASFAVDAQTHNGDMENDFGLSQQDNDDRHTLHGAVGGGGAKITISTTEGDVTLRKVTSVPLPPTPPSAPAVPKTMPTPKLPRDRKLALQMHPAM